jgi:hypothetical protein
MRRNIAYSEYACTRWERIALLQVDKDPVALEGKIAYAHQCSLYEAELTASLINKWGLVISRARQSPVFGAQVDAVVWGTTLDINILLDTKGKAMAPGRNNVAEPRVLIEMEGSSGLPLVTNDGDYEPRHVITDSLAHD